MGKHHGGSIGFTFTHETDTGDELEFDISAKVTAFTPAQISGPPENCYPAEGGETEDVEIVFEGETIDPEQFEALCGPKAVEALEIVLAEKAAELQFEPPGYED